MVYLLWSLGAIVGLLLAAGAFLLLVPGRYAVTLRARTHQPLFFQAELGWGAFLGFRFQAASRGRSLFLRLFWREIRLPLDAERQRKKPEEEEESGPGWQAAGKGWGLLRDEASRRHIMRFAWRAWQEVKPREFCITGEMGWAEPHLTGWVMAVLYGCEHACRIPTLVLQVDPVWDEERLEVDLTLAGRVATARLLGIGLRLAFSPQTWRMVRQWRRGRTPAVAVPGTACW